MKLRLPDVTLAMIEIQCPDLARLAMEDSMRDIEFGDAIMFTDEPVPVPGTRWVKVPRWPSVEACAQFMWYELPDHIKTKFVIVLQWDSWIVNADCWTDEFLQYDYVGAPWWYDDSLNVGNGSGLRSMALMRFLQSNKERFPLSIKQEDHLLGRTYRPALEKHGFKWPSEVLASRFSFECAKPSNDSRHFMFHDSFNFPLVLEGERLAERLRLMRAKPTFARKVKELDSGRRPKIVPRLAGPEKAKPTTGLHTLNIGKPSIAAQTATTFREFQKARVDALLTTKRRPHDAADAHNLLPGLVELILQARPRSVIEIGCDRGVATELFLLTTARVAAVDSWQDQRTFQEFVERCAAYPHLEICRGNVPEILHKFGAEFDLCYIDAERGYDAVRRDILACARIVKPSGWFAGHGYDHAAVERAVLSLVGEAPLVFHDGSWLARNRLSQHYLAEDATVTLAPAEADSTFLPDTVPQSSL